ncbi:hypothetical protein GCM10027040_29420 [Halomonas shantousis]
MREMKAAVTSKRWRHSCGPALIWMKNKVVAKVDAKENIYPRKENPENKTDGIVAIHMALGRASCSHSPAASLGRFHNNAAGARASCCT